MNVNPDRTVRLRQLVEAFTDVTVTVVGDLVADEFVLGDISRVSREAPVLILRHRERSVVPGGGANAINNLADLGVRVLPVGIVGADEPGRLLLRCLQRKRVTLDGILCNKDYATVTKTRILAGMMHTAGQQVVRIDREPAGEPPKSAQRQLIASAVKFLRLSHALLISDYGYGAASPAVLTAIGNNHKSKNIPVTLDSRHRILAYTGATAATPNESEVEEALGIEIGNNWQSLVEAGKRIMSRMRLQSLVITRGKDGMVAFERGQKPLDIPIFGSDEVADVTGAGDTVIATFTAAIAAGATTLEAAQLANYAGGIVVMKRGTATVSRAELLRALAQSPPKTRTH
jgi:rfaE bifunctional protein kinase chain/domain